MNNKKVLVTGANGQLGQTIKELFFENDKNIEFVFVKKADLDISNVEKLKAFFKETNFDYCINCAAYTNVEQAEDSQELAFKINAEAVKNIATICNKNNIILIHISTDYVFDGEKKTPYLETDMANPLNEYGRSKYAGEQYIKEITVKYFIIRTSWLYSKYRKNFFKTIVNKINENQSLKITTAETGTPTSCIDLAEFIYTLILSRSRNFGVYHYSNEGEATWYDFAIEIASHYNHYNISKITPVDSFKTKAKRPRYSVLSKSKANNLVAKTAPNWEYSIERVILTDSIE
ncbi:dTDP-4-dehydrorhamnose reductase [Pontimicrobium sp. MEBiC01747]